MADHQTAQEEISAERGVAAGTTPITTTTTTTSPTPILPQPHPNETTANENSDEQRNLNTSTGEDYGSGASVEEGKASNVAVPTDPEASRTKVQTTIIMVCLCASVFLAALDITIISTALPTISEHFHSNAGYTWIGSAYLLANAASTPSWGKISDIWGRKPILLCASCVFFLGSVLSATSVSISMLIAGRAVQGIGGGGLIILVNICISDLFSMRNRGQYFGMLGMVWALASGLGPILGGAFTQKVSWRWCFYVNLPITGPVTILLYFFLHLETPRTPMWDGLKAVDWAGSLTVVGGTLMLLLGLEFGGVSFPWDSATVICLIVFGFVVIGLFVLNERKFARYPIMPTRIFSDVSNLASLGVCFCHGFTFIALLVLSNSRFLCSPKEPRAVPSACLGCWQLDASPVSGRRLGSAVPFIYFNLVLC
jgi:MFS family permease